MKTQTQDNIIKKLSNGKEVKFINGKFVVGSQKVRGSIDTILPHQRKDLDSKHPGNDWVMLAGGRIPLTKEEAEKAETLLKDWQTKQKEEEREKFRKYWEDCTKKTWAVIESSRSNECLINEIAICPTETQERFNEWLRGKVATISELQDSFEFRKFESPTLEALYDESKFSHDYHINHWDYNDLSYPITKEIAEKIKDEVMDYRRKKIAEKQEKINKEENHRNELIAKAKCTGKPQLLRSYMSDYCTENLPDCSFDSIAVMIDANGKTFETHNHCH